MWIIKNKKFNNYYHSTIEKKIHHFTTDCEKAHKFKTKGNANKQLEKFKKLREYSNFEIMKEGGS